MIETSHSDTTSKLPSPRADKAEFASAFNQLDPHKFSSNFSSVKKGTCVECHGGGQVSQTCTTCHEYHQEPGFKKTMMRQVAEKK